MEYQGKRQCKYYVSVITGVDDGEKLYHVTFYKRYGKDSFIFNEKDTDEIGEECIIGIVQPPAVKQRSDEILYFFDLSSYRDIKVE